MSSTSLNKIAWNKFRKNNLSLFSLVFISCLIFLAVFAYLFIPDKTPMANQMYLELALKKPGTKISFIQVPQKNEIKSDFFLIFFLERLLNILEFQLIVLAILKVPHHIINTIHN